MARKISFDMFAIAAYLDVPRANSIEAVTDMNSSRAPRTPSSCSIQPACAYFGPRSKCTTQLLPTMNPTDMQTLIMRTKCLVFMKCLTALSRSSRIESDIIGKNTCPTTCPNPREAAEEMDSARAKQPNSIRFTNFPTTSRSASPARKYVEVETKMPAPNARMSLAAFGSHSSETRFSATTWQAIGKAAVAPTRPPTKAHAVGEMSPQTTETRNPKTSLPVFRIVSSLSRTWRVSSHMEPLENPRTRVEREPTTASAITAGW